MATCLSLATCWPSLFVAQALSGLWDVTSLPVSDPAVALPGLAHLHTKKTKKAWNPLKYSCKNNMSYASLQKQWYQGHKTCWICSNCALFQTWAWWKLQEHLWSHPTCWHCTGLHVLWQCHSGSWWGNHNKKMLACHQEEQTYPAQALAAWMEGDVQVGCLESPQVRLGTALQSQLRTAQVWTCIGQRGDGALYGTWCCRWQRHLALGMVDDNRWPGIIFKL